MRSNSSLLVKEIKGQLVNRTVSSLAVNGKKRGERYRVTGSRILIFIFLLILHFYKQLIVKKNSVLFTLIGVIYLRSHLARYLSVDQFGNVLCESDERDAGSRFQISISDDGKWALRNESRGYYLGGNPEKLTCTAKVPGNTEYWSVHLAARPQVNLRSVGRKRFAHLSESQDEIHVDSNIPWGEDTLFTLEFRADEDGRYALHTCNNK